MKLLKEYRIHEMNNRDINVVTGFKFAEIADVVLCNF